MRSLVLAAALLGVLLAGCSSAPDPAEPTTDPMPVSTSTAPTVAPVPDLVLTDTMHFLEAPHMAARAPTATEPSVMAVPSSYDELVVDDPVLHWRAPLPPVAAITGEAVLWVDVEGTVVNAGYANVAGCFWILWVAVADTAGTTLAEIGTCLMELPVVTTGIRQLRFEMPTLDATDLPADHVVLGLQTTAAPSSAGTVTVLAGTTEFDSVARIDGLQVPLDTQTVLL